MTKHDYTGWTDRSLARALAQSRAAIMGKNLPTYAQQVEEIEAELARRAEASELS